MPDILLRWLAYIPVCILSALVIEGLFEKQAHIVTVQWMNVMALIPTLVVALVTKSLSKTVVVGVLTMAILRYLFT